MNRRRYGAYGAVASGAFYAGRKFKNWYSPPLAIKARPRATFNTRVRRVINRAGEPKFIDTTIAINPIAGSSIITPLTLVATGDTDVTREGSRIKIISIQIRGIIFTDADSATGSTCRMILFRNNTRNNGSLPAVVSILETDSFKAFRNKDNNYDFKILWDHVDVVNPSGAPVADDVIVSRRVKYYKRYKKALNAYYDGNGATIGDAEKGHLFLMVMSNNASTFAPTFDLNIRVVFKDI